MKHINKYNIKVVLDFVESIGGYYTKSDYPDYPNNQCYDISIDMIHESKFINFIEDLDLEYFKSDEPEGSTISITVVF